MTPTRKSAVAQHAFNDTRHKKITSGPEQTEQGESEQGNSSELGSHSAPPNQGRDGFLSNRQLSMGLGYWVYRAHLGTREQGITTDSKNPTPSNI
ncbi:unnamed protein product [Nezara viridula]|uniref:Uncharacterized protein n=1 Tax=Nezara viridula TaxID=85310 RepID=A0A9P0HF88_NEZVI|nr:unnamed protein product [Nezara viridula]